MKEALHRVNWVKVLEILKKITIDWRDRKLITNLYMQQKSVIRVNANSEPRHIGLAILYMERNDDGRVDGR
ncbi:hypothetical protein CHS0354_032382, partial [Potamilus streckersoni]